MGTRLRAVVAVLVAIAAGTAAYVYHAQAYTDGVYSRDGAEFAWTVALITFGVLIAAQVVVRLGGSVRAGVGVALVVALVLFGSGVPLRVARSITRFGFGEDGGSPGGSSGIRYVALGDSYSSGEGVPPFESQSNENGCHRSTYAYARVLDERVEEVSLVHFGACSGATVDSMRAGDKGESPQTAQLTFANAKADVDLVTVTIGGNPLFKQVAETCFFADCRGTAGLAEGTVADPAFREQLRLLYAEVSAAARDAPLVALTYPRPFPELDESVTSSPCRGREFLEGLTIGAGEIRAANAFVSALNAAIRDAAASAGALVVDVEDAFSGHELCGDGESYLHSANPNPLYTVYSYHPTRAGQAELAAVLERALRDTDLL